MTTLYSVFVRYEKDNYEDDDSYYRGEPLLVEDYIGSFGTRNAAEAVASKVKLDDYGPPEWDEDVWTIFAFVYEHRLDSPLDTNEIYREADRISNKKLKEWEVSPAGLAHKADVEKSRRDYAEKKAAKIEAQKARVREMARVASLARAAKKAALASK